MEHHGRKMLPINDTRLQVYIVEGAIVLAGLATIAPTFTVRAARETAERLASAAEALALERRQMANYADA